LPESENEKIVKTIEEGIKALKKIQNKARKGAFRTISENTRTFEVPGASVNITIDPKSAFNLIHIRLSNPE